MSIHILFKIRVKQGESIFDGTSRRHDVSRLSCARPWSFRGATCSSTAIMINPDLFYSGSCWWSGGPSKRVRCCAVCVRRRHSVAPCFCEANKWQNAERNMFFYVAFSFLSGLLCFCWKTTISWIILAKFKITTKLTSFYQLYVRKLFVLGAANENSQIIDL